MERREERKCIPWTKFRALPLSVKIMSEASSVSVVCARRKSGFGIDLFTSGEVMLQQLVQSSCRHSSSITKCHEGRKVLLGRVERKEFKISTKRVKKRQDREEHSWMNKERKNNDGKKKLETENIKAAGRNRRWHVRQKVKIPWVMQILSFFETHSTQVSHLISLSSLFPLTY